MKVICIDATAKGDSRCKGDFMVKEGGIYIVNGEFDRGGQHWYQLKEDVEGNGWNSIYFIPLSTKFDESLMVCLRTKPKNKKNVRNFVKYLF